MVISPIQDPVTEIQTSILPKSAPTIESLDIAAGLLSAPSSGGDFYNFIQKDENNLLLYMGDVTGKGVVSGVIAALTDTLIHHFALTSDPQKTLEQTNAILQEKTSSNMLVTLSLLNWNEKEKTLQYLNAGHKPLIHYHAKEKKVSLLSPQGMALGMVPDISDKLKPEQIPLQKDDVLVLYTDGLIECWKNEHETYGLPRFKRAINEYSDLPTALAIRNALLADVKEFSGKYEQKDDIALVVLKRK
jgi:sigma-B regulation protein RsbU (phosphoserine phosphatase)